MIKRIWAIMMAVLLLLCLPVSACAAAHVVTAPSGSITVKVVHNGTALKGLELTAYRVGDLVKTDSGKTEFQRVFVRKSLNEQIWSDPEGLAEELRTFVKNNSHMTFAKQCKAADEKGNVMFDDCVPGVYLIVQERNYSLNGIAYGKMKHFLVTVPYNGNYQVDVTGKTSLDVFQEPEATSPTRPGSGSPGGSRLPQTGQVNWPVPVLASSGMLLFFVGWILYRREEKDGYDA